MPLRPSDLSWLLGPFALAVSGSGLRGSRLPPVSCFARVGFRGDLFTSITRNPQPATRNLFPLLLLLFCVPAAWAQDRPPPLPTPQPDSAAVAPDTSRARTDTTASRLPGPRQTTPTSTSGLDKPIQFTAKDSLVIRFDDANGDRGRLVGNAVVSYGEARLSAHTIDILFDLDELRAEGLPSDTGLVGMPAFNQGTETFSGTSFAYNMRTERGRVVGARTQFEDGFIRADVAKVREDSTVFIRDGLYTTCNCGPDETPSYSMRSDKMKIVDQKWVYTGPIQLYIYDIPTPFWLPFGFLPYKEGRRSGLLAPEYGEDQRGFYLRNWGYYWAINDYMDLQMRAGLWTRGSWQLNPSYRYNRRDYFNGGLSFDILHERSGEKEDPDAVTRDNLSVRWSHNQTLNPTARLTANVNLTSSSYLRTVSNQYDDNVRQSVSSSIQYNKRWQGGRSMSLNLRQNQILATGGVDLTLPELTFSQSSMTPFKRAAGGGRSEQWFERLQFSYSGRLSNRYNFQPLTDDPTAADIAWYEALFDQQKYEQATGRDDSRFDFRATHRIPVSAPFSIDRLPVLGTFRLNISPNASYSEDWFIETERRMADTANTVIREATPGFFALRQFNTGVSANTTFYGIFPLKVGPYQGVRHTVRPSVGFNYRPDFSSDFWGYTRTYTDTSGAETEYDVVAGVQRGLQQTISFGLDNTFETKHVRADSTGEAQTRVLNLFTVNARSSYNFAADSLKLAPVSLTARTNVINGLNLNFSSTFSPYALNEAGTRQIDHYVFSLKDFRVARLTRLSLSGDFRLSSNRRGGSRTTPTRTGPQAFNTTNTSTLGLNDPFSNDPFLSSEVGEAGAFSQWSLSFRFTYSISKPLTTLSRTATMNSSFDFNLTPTWKVRGQTGYDFERKEIVTTTLNILKDFECWEMSFRWVPFGRFQSWGFDLHVKSGKLSEFLRLRQPKSDRDRGFGL